MKFYMLRFVATLLLVGGSIFLHLPQRVKSMTELAQEQSSALPMRHYLADLGKTYDSFFTIEEGWTEDNPADRITSHWLQRPSQAKSLKDELEHIRQIVPNFTYEIDKTNPRLIHILDARLAQQKGYGLARVIKSIDFQGKLSDLPSELKKQGIPVSSPWATDTRSPGDDLTVVQIKAEGLSVRDALSNFIPLEGRLNRILWIAATKLGQREVSNVHFLMSAKIP